MNDSRNRSLESIADAVERVRCSQCNCCLDVSMRRVFESIACDDCGNVIVVPVCIGPYYVYGVLGQGGMGCVYDAWDAELERMVALKLLLCPESGLSSAQTADFENESRAAAGICHANIARVYDFGYHREQPYLVMERVEGAHFDVMIREVGALDTPFVLRTGLDVADGLSLADASGLLHGDIKPENILFDAEMRTKLVDFGLATYVGDAGSERIRGTPHYIPPERLQRRALDARADIYSLGATLYHALCGQTPFTGPDPQTIAMARLSESPAPLRTLRPDCSQTVERVVMRMLEQSPARRYPNYRSLMADLHEALEKPSSETDSITPARKGTTRTADAPPRPTAPTTRWRRVAKTSIGVLLALGLLTAVFFAAYLLAGRS